MWREHFINANPATIMQKLYQLKAEQDGKATVPATQGVAM